MIKITNNKSKYQSLTKLASGRYKLNFNLEPYYITDEDGNQVETDLATWTEHYFSSKPSIGQVKNFILDTINKEIDQKILSGMVWKDMPIWLSNENQFNYKAAYDLAVMSQGQSLPVMFKFGTTDEPVYYNFETLEDISNFYISAMNYINTTLAEGWKKKDSIDWTVYENALK